MFYSFMRFLFSLTLKLFYKRLFVNGLENIPKDKYIILASNHPNTFMDAFIVGVFTTGRLSTMVRSDVFKNRFTSWLLNLLRLIPVYRSQEGAKNLHKNEISFIRAIEQMKKGAQILIFSEGTSIQGKKLLKIKKGTARIAFKAEEILQDEVLVIPVGINYTHFTAFRREVMINFGTPISTKKYPRNPDHHSNTHLNLLTQDLYEAMKKNLLIIEDLHKEPFLDHLLNLKRHELRYPFLRRILKGKKRFELEQEWLSQFQNSVLNEETYSTKKLALHEYQNELKRAHLYDLKPDFMASKKLKYYILFILTSPFYLLGSITHFFTFYISHFIATKTMRDSEFYTSVWLSATMILFFIYSVIMFIYLPTPNFFIAQIIIPITSFMKYFVDDFLRDTKHAFFLWRLKKNQAHYQRLVTLRHDILS